VGYNTPLSRRFLPHQCGTKRLPRVELDVLSYMLNHFATSRLAEAVSILEGVNVVRSIT
jgi:hypothetical protein